MVDAPETETETPADTTPTGPAPIVDRRAAAFLAIDSARREMLAGDGVNVDDVPAVDLSATEPDPEPTPAPEPVVPDEVATLRGEVTGLKSTLDQVLGTLQNLRPARPDTETPADTGDQPAGDGPTDGIDYQSVAHAIQFGSPEEAAEALRKASEGHRQTGGDLDEAGIAKRVRHQMEYDGAIARFSTEHPTIYNDPFLGEFAAKAAQQIMGEAVKKAIAGEAPMPAYDAVFSAAADFTYDWVKRTGTAVGERSEAARPSDPKSEEIDVPARTARKISASHMPAPGTSPARPPVEPDPQPQDELQRRQSGIADIMAARRPAYASPRA